MTNKKDRPACCGQKMYIQRRTPDGRPRWYCGKCKTSTTNSGETKLGYDADIAAARYKTLRRSIRDGCKRFVVTCAQNNTGKFGDFYRSLLRYCEYHGAELIIIPVRYKNVTAYTANQDYEVSWHPELQPYIMDQKLELGGGVQVRGDISIQATAFNPLSGMEPIGGQKWTIFGHPQFAMESVASPLGKMPKRMYTCGTVTDKNYSRSKVGAKAEFHHVQGALIVEVFGKKAFIRQLNADSKGGFYDVSDDVPRYGASYYAPDKITYGHKILALTTGDEHIKFNLPSVRQATYDKPNSIVNSLRPEYIVRHDILDAFAGSHHHEKDDVKQFGKFHRGDNDGRKELDEVVSFLNETTPEGATNIIVASNHDEHLTKWLARVDPRKDHLNALLIHELKTAQYQAELKGEDVNPLHLYIGPKLTCKFRFLTRNDQFVLYDVDYAQHGDVGINGARGNAAMLARTTYKLVIGHSHGARIVKGVYQVGTSTETLEYERGLGARSQTHCIQYANGKRTLIDIFGAKWRL